MLGALNYLTEQHLPESEEIHRLRELAILFDEFISKKVTTAESRWRRRRRKRKNSPENPNPDRTRSPVFLFYSYGGIINITVKPPNATIPFTILPDIRHIICPEDHHSSDKSTGLIQIHD